jgi:hypothetical protein
MQGASSGRLLLSPLGGAVKKQPDLSRFATDNLGTMLQYHKILAKYWIDGGEWATSKWLTKLGTLIVIELNKREMEAREAEEAQQTIPW